MYQYECINCGEKVLSSIRETKCEKCGSIVLCIKDDNHESNRSHTL